MCCLILINSLLKNISSSQKHVKHKFFKIVFKYLPFRWSLIQILITFPKFFLLQSFVCTLSCRASYVLFQKGWKQDFSQEQRSPSLPAPTMFKIVYAALQTMNYLSPCKLLTHRRNVTSLSLLTLEIFLRIPILGSISSDFYS